MTRLWVALALCLLAPGSGTGAAGPKTPPRGIFARPERLTPEFLAGWKANGATAVVVALDEETKGRWREVADRVERAGMTLWPWVEVGRNPALADAHPDWMAATGGHHDDWRRRFPDAPKAKEGEVIKAWPWVPIGYAPAFDAHRRRLKTLLTDLPGAWAGVFLNDLQAGPSSCGCGNDQCRWALDYGTPPTAERTPGDDAAARLVAELVARHPGKAIVPVWVTECEAADLPGARDGTGLCGGVACARGDCWPRYVRAWNPLVKATDGPIAVALWSGTFRRDPGRWIETAVPLFQGPPQGGSPLPAERTVAVIQAWGAGAPAAGPLLKRVEPLARGWVLMLDPIEQSWEPRAVANSKGRR
ncbi:MAG TPA: hypothetical protein VG406_02750 [Isosphaeraceae bacterium]|nr:hypothetical protein [Isosphaeraceae bacterium]